MITLMLPVLQSNRGWGKISLKSITMKENKIDEKHPADLTYFYLVFENVHLNIDKPLYIILNI